VFVAVVLAVAVTSAVAQQNCLTVDGVSTIKSFEGFRANQYRDSAGIWTIGYGTLCSTGTLKCPGPVTEVAASEELGRAVAANYGPCVRQYVKQPLTNSQYSALISFAYNAGCGSLQNVVSSAGGVVANFPAHMSLYNKARVSGQLQVVQGLVNRRAKEVALFRSTAAAPCATQNGVVLRSAAPLPMSGPNTVPGAAHVSPAHRHVQADLKTAAEPFPVHPPVKFVNPMLPPHTESRVFAEGVDTGRVQWVGPRHVHRRLKMGRLQKNRKHRGVKADGKEGGVRRHTL